MVTVNGKEENIKGLTLMQYLIKAEYDVSRVAIELNGNIISKSLFSKTIISDGDKIEIVCFVGGG